MSFLLIFFSIFLTAQEDYRSRIAILPMENGTGLDQYNPLCNTITETVSLVLKFLKDYKVLDEQDADMDKLSAAGDLDEMRKAAKEEGVDEVVFGRATFEDNVFEFTLSLYNREKGEITNEQSVEAFSVLDVFDAADELTEGLIGQLSDVYIAFGSVKLIQTGGKGNYTVNLDGYPLRNPDRIFRKVLNGQYDISISQERLTGPAVVFNKNITVSEGEETLVEFSLPPGLPEEFVILEEKGRSLLSLGESEDSFDQFLGEITAFQNETMALEYDSELEALRDNFLDLAGAAASRILKARMEETDSSFYAEDPSFSETLDSYVDISALVQTQFEVKKLSSTQELTIVEPQKVQLGGDNTVYFTCFDTAKKNWLIGWNPDLDISVSRELSGRSDFYKGDFITFEHRIYLWEPGQARVEVLDSNLNTLQTLSIPDLPLGPENLKLAVSAKGLLYVLSGDLVRVFDLTRQYDDEGNLLPPDRYYGIEEKLQELMRQAGDQPVDVFFDRARHLNVFFPVSSQHYIMDENGTVLKQIPLEFCHPFSRLASDSSGYLYVSLYDENSIAKYTPGGEFITSYGEYGTQDGQFSIPTGIAISSRGTLYIADSYNGRIQSLNPLTPPVLYPEIARYSEDLDRRIERTEVAVKKVESAREDITMSRHAWNLFGSGALLGITGLLAVQADVSGANSVYAYEFYQNSTDPGDISEARETAESGQTVQKITEIGSLAALGLSASLLTTTLLDIGLDSSLTRYNQQQAQIQDMNTLYETDPEKYRSIRASHRIGIWTGIVPPVLGIGMTALLASSDVNSPESLALGATLIGIGIPPIFSHLHGGRFSKGLFLAGLSADLLAVAALMNMDRLDALDESWNYDKYAAYDSDPQPSPSGGASFDMGRMFDRMGDLSVFYLIAAAYGIRLTAGIFDARYGWTYTNNYNRYKAVKPVEEEETASLNWNMSPFLDRTGELGLALNLTY